MSEKVSDFSFDFQTRYCNYKNCRFKMTRYTTNGNLYLGIIDSENDPIAHCSVNPGQKIDDDKLVVKDWTENEGMDLFLQDQGIIENTACDYIPSGFVIISIFKLTEKGKKLFEGV